MDKQAYITSKAWQNNPYLIIPPDTPESLAGSAHKKCECCQEVKFTVEFMDNEEFVDSKLPACDTCIKARDGRNLLNKTGKTNQCRKCEKTKPLGEFAFDSAKHELGNICLVCS